METQSITIFDILFMAVVTMSLWYLLVFLYRDYFTDSFRQDIFTLRDDLFDATRNGLIDFNHPAYGLLRETMNGYLRFGHQLNFLALAITYAFPSTRKALKDPSLCFEDKWIQKTQGLTIEQKKKLTQYRDSMQKCVVKYIWGTSPTLILLTITFLVVLIPIIIIQSLKKRALKLLLIPVSSLNSTAMAYGKA